MKLLVLLGLVSIIGCGKVEPKKEPLSKDKINKERESHLKAVSAGNFKAIKKYFNKKNINKEIDFGGAVASPLMTAIKSNRKEVVSYFLRLGADLYTCGDDLATAKKFKGQDILRNQSCAFGASLKFKDGKITKLLLDRGFNLLSTESKIDYDDKACEFESSDESLKTCGVNINHEMDGLELNWTSFYYLRGRTDLIQHVVEKDLLSSDDLLILLKLTLKENNTTGAEIIMTKLALTYTDLMDVNYSWAKKLSTLSLASHVLLTKNVMANSANVLKQVLDKQGDLTLGDASPLIVLARSACYKSLGAEVDEMGAYQNHMSPEVLKMAKVLLDAGVNKKLTDLSGMTVVDYLKSIGRCDECTFQFKDCSKLLSLIEIY